MLPLWLAVALAWPKAAISSPPPVQITPTLYQTEHCLFVIDSSVTWAFPATAYNDIYGSNGGTFPRLASYFNEITTRFPSNYFSICYIANTGAANVPNYIDRIYKATGISSGLGSAGLGSTGDPNSPQSFATVDMCRYNLPGGNVIAPVLAVFDHEIGHAWGAQLFYTLNQPSLANGHWLPNSTIDCQLGSGTSTDGYVTVNKIYGDPTNGFRWQRVDNIRSNDYAVFSEQTLFLLGVAATFPTSYVLNNPVFNADLTMSSSSVDTFDHAAAVATYGVRNPDYKTAPKKFKLGFVYIARDLNEVNTVYQAVEQSIDQFCNAEAISTTSYRSQTPFLVDTLYRASVDGRLSDLDGNATPTLTVTDTYVSSVDGTATINFSASDPDGPAPTVSVVPGSNHVAVVGSAVQISGLPDGVHFFTLKAADASGKKVFGHFVVEVHCTPGSVSIATQPADLTAIAGSTPTFNAVANGDPATLAYQWYRRAARTSTWNLLSNGGAYSGATTGALSIACTPAMDGDRFLCVTSDATGSVTTREASLIVNETIPVITAQPADKNITPGNSTFFRVTAGNNALNYGYYQYQWQRQAGGAGSWTDLTASSTYSGVNGSQLTIFGTTLGMSSDRFRCVVTNTAGSATSNAGVLSVGAAPAITAQPQPIDGFVGQTVSFSITVTGAAPLTYQWYKYGTLIGNSATLVLSNIQLGDAGTYGVTITNAFGLAYSNNVGLTVTNVSGTAPAITAQPVDRTVVVGQPASFTVAVTGSPAVSYQWKRNGFAIAGATAATYAIGAVYWYDVGSYSVTVTNPLGSVTSNAANLALDDTGLRRLWVMNGTTASGTIDLGIFDLNWQIVGAVDFNSDGEPDILWQNSLTGQCNIWFMNGTVYLGTFDLGNFDPSWRIVTAADFNNDEHPDILWQNPYTGDCCIWLMNGTACFDSVALGRFDTQWRMVAAVDFTSDGHPDILWQNPFTGDCCIWLMNGTACFDSVALGRFDTQWRMIAAGDFNHDNHSDILWQNTLTGQCSVWLMHNTACVGSLDLGQADARWHMAAVVDFNHDGQVDILWQRGAAGP